MIELVINGKQTFIEEPVTLLSYLESLGVKFKNIAVAHNGIVLRGEEINTVILSDGDNVEVVRAVGGG
jgi:thiamine biosynthesis protein ThiS